MYQSPHFEMHDLDRLRQLVRAYPLGLLITAGTHGVCANHIPFLLLQDTSGVRLQCHMARANEQWRDIEAGAHARVVFSGPNHYISPNWYPSKADHGRAVPTWNYASVHATGDVSVHHDRSWLQHNATALTKEHEDRLWATSLEPDDKRPPRWTLDEAPESFIGAQLNAIVGVEFQNVNLSGKFKLSQNRSAADQSQVAAQLRKLGAEANNVADMMDKA